MKDKLIIHKTMTKMWVANDVGMFIVEGNSRPCKSAGHGAYLNYKEAVVCRLVRSFVGAYMH